MAGLGAFGSRFFLGAVFAFLTSTADAAFESSAFRLTPLAAVAENALDPAANADVTEGILGGTDATGLPPAATFEPENHMLIDKLLQLRIIERVMRYLTKKLL